MKFLKPILAYFATIILSHIHQDHIQGLQFYKPLFLANSKLDLYGLNFPDEDLKDTLLGDGLIIIIIVFILAVINEVSIILYTKYAEIPAQNPFALCVYPIFALAQCTAITNIPIVRTLIAYIETVPLMILQIVIQHKRDFEKWKH